jgi:hypothetical protein
MKRRVKRLRLKALKAFRSHYLLGVTVAVVAIAAAAGLGVFDPDEGRRDVPAAGVFVAPAGTLPAGPNRSTPQGPPFLTVTYVFVSSEDERAVWNDVETTINQRELLSKLALEVLVVTNSDEAAAAYEMIDAIRARYPWNEYVIQDLR